MSITDELRKAADEIASTATPCGASPDYIGVRRKIDAIADRIDAEHEAKMSYWQGASYKDGYDEGFASADDWLAQHEDAMAEHGWVKLPVDANGEYWFCGDKIMLPDGDVVEIIGIGGDWLYYCVASVAMTVFGRIRAHDKRHYKQPTVEDVLREFVERYLDYEGVPSAGRRGIGEALMDEYAAKLRLAEVDG